MMQDTYLGQYYWRNVEVAGPDECWVWKGRAGRYGVFDWKGAHRLSYESLVGPIPEGLHIDHLCNNRLCVNPAHMEPVTAAENNRRAGKLRRLSHCKRGHPYAGKNLYEYTDSLGRYRRYCKACQKIAMQAKVKGTVPPA